ncbi:MAG: HAD family hydrolase, partial [Nanoarchaeota archaeon]
EVLSELESLQKKYKLILVSNTDCFSIGQVLDKFQLRNYFTDIFLSCDVGMIKTDEKFLLDVLEKAGIDAKDCVVVGDSILSDMEAAKAVDIKAVLLDRKERQHFHPKIKNLKELSPLLSEL